MLWVTALDPLAAPTLGYAYVPVQLCHYAFGLSMFLGQPLKPIWLVVWNFFFPHILGIILPTDFHIVQRGWNHQPAMVIPIYWMIVPVGYAYSYLGRHPVIPTDQRPSEVPIFLFFNPDVFLVHPKPIHSMYGISTLWVTWQWKTPINGGGDRKITYFNGPFSGKPWLMTPEGTNFCPNKITHWFVLWNLFYFPIYWE